MTSREFYLSIINSNFSDEVKEFAKDALNALDAKNEKRRSSSKAKRDEKNAPIQEEILSVLAAEPKTASMIAEELNDKYSVQKIANLLKGMVERKEVKTVAVKIAKRGLVTAYTTKE